MIGLDGRSEQVLYAPPGLGASLQAFPAGFLPRLRALDDLKIEKLAVQWAEALSGPEYTHSVSGEQIEEGWTTEQTMRVLSRILTLALAAIAEQRLYLLVEA